MKDKGYVLFIVLVFMQALMLLGLGGLQTNRLEIKSNDHSLQHEIQLQRANVILQHIEKNLLASDARCLIPITHHINKNNISWWQEWGCSENRNGIRYYYVVEKLGIDHCALIKHTKNQSLIADYYRITLFAPLKNGRLILQSTIAKPVFQLDACNDNTHYVSIGRQMWREG